MAAKKKAKMVTVREKASEQKNDKKKPSFLKAKKGGRVKKTLRS